MLGPHMLMMMCASGSDITTLQKLIDAKSAEVNVADAEEGDTPLGVACRRVVAPGSFGM